MDEIILNKYELFLKSTFFKFISIAVFASFFVHFNLYAQWSSIQATRGPAIYYYGYVGINSTTPLTILDLRDANEPSMNILIADTSCLALGISTGASWNSPRVTTGDASIFNRSPLSGDLILGSSLSAVPTSQTNGSIRFFTSNASSGGDAERMTILNNGKVLIGTTNIQANTTGLLYVNGQTHCTGVILLPTNSANFPDYVFNKHYKLMSLNKLDRFVKYHKHLPGIKSGREVTKTGLDSYEMTEFLLKKIEELTLYTIKLEKANALLDLQISSLIK